MTEAELRGSIVRALRRRGALVLDLSSTPGSNAHLKGVSDLIVVLDGGRHVWVEVKLPKTGRQSDAQRLFERRLTRRGGQYLIATSLEGALGQLGF